ncbi:MAG: alpha/beta hydrolase [Bacteroidetes bacterium]|nr:alpha/beta hydrolase [Bacteroidota bacterium]
MSVARGMPMWDLPGWVKGWSRVAADVRKLADSSLERGRKFSACEHYLRAANYFQMAEYYAIIALGNHVHFGLMSQQCFESAMPLLRWNGESVSPGINGRIYPSYFFSPDASGEARPTVLVVGGLESSAEEMYFNYGVSALQRGYNVMLFQGPGQAGVLRRQADSRLQPDYEIPLQLALDYLNAREDVDSDRLAVIGNGLGGYFASRIAAFDPRVKALIVNPPHTNLHRMLVQVIGQRALIIDVDFHALNELPPSLMRGDLKLLVLNICRRFGVTHLQAMIKTSMSYVVEELLYRIQCPTLCIRGMDTHQEMVRQSDDFCNGIRSQDKQLVLLPNLHEADAQNHFSNIPRLNQEIFDWLDERFHPLDD